MEKNSRKEKIVKQLLNKDFDVTDEDELIEMLLDNPTAIDSDKEEDERRTMGDKLADKVTEIAGSWGFIFGFCIFLVVWIVINYIIHHDGVHAYLDNGLFRKEIIGHYRWRLNNGIK